MSKKTEAHHKEINLWDIILKYAIILALGFFIVAIDEEEFFNPSITTRIVVVIAFIKMTSLFIFNYLQIVDFAKYDMPYYKFLLYMLVHISVIILSFAIDFYCIYRIDNIHFTGLSANWSTWRVIFEMVYFSTLSFNNLGFYDIVPISVSTKILVMLEIATYFLTIILVLSDFISLKESILEFRVNKKKKK